MPIVVELVEDLGSDANVYGHASPQRWHTGTLVVRTDGRGRAPAWARPSTCGPATGAAARLPRRHRRPTLGTHSHNGGRSTRAALHCCTTPVA